MLQRHNSVVNFYRIRLTSLRILHSLSTNTLKRALGSALKASKLAAVFTGALALALAGCAAVDSRPDAEVLKDRAQARWDAVVKGDFKAAYGYLSPTTRSTLTPEAYEGGVRKGFYKGVQVDKVTCESPALCDTHSTVEYEFRGARVKTPLKETWIKEGSTWWYVQK
jgi:hypothetical protein